jgi:hypothetical protein
MINIGVSFRAKPRNPVANLKINTVEVVKANGTGFLDSAPLRSE